MAEAVQDLLVEAVRTLSAGGAWKITRACDLLGVARSSFYYQRHGINPAKRCRKHAPQPAALSAAERDQARQVMVGEQYQDLSIQQTYWRAFDAGLIGCSQSTFYRIARTEGLVGDRRRGRHATPTQPRRVKPIVSATGVGQLWSWDITELKGLGRQRFQLFLAMDVFSRYPVGFRVETTGCREHAVAMFTDAFTTHGHPKVLHSDNGTQMRSKDLAALLDDTVSASFSRPYVSDDNPFSEALFKTIKYDLAMPERFTSLNHARQWMTQFLRGYATEHRHGGLAHHTPHEVHTGQYHHTRRARQAHLDAYYLTHPERFRRQPRAPHLPTLIGINLSKAA